jgi:alkylated DNA repair dioxygenase AlkB
MELFDRPADANQNLLPYDGKVYYYGRVFSRDQADQFYEELMNTIAWQHDEARMYGKTFVTRRKVAWYGDKPFEYEYSNTRKIALPWTQELLQLKTQTENVTGETFNSCLLNLYHTGEEGMAYHSDDETDLKKNGAIASISLGAERKFAFKHKKSKETINVFLEHGSILIMKGTTQTHWLHRLPPTKKIATPRINLTFRTIVEAQAKEA